MTTRRIGGQFELRPADLAAIPAVRDDGAGIRTTTARSALALVEDAMRSEGSPPSQPVLLPCYVCSAVVQPFRQAGREIRFYRVDDMLRVDLDDLERLARKHDPAAILFVQYFGVPIGHDLAQALAGARSRMRVVEDCAQGGLLEPGSRMGHTGDFVVTSLRKYLPVPDGATLIDRTGTVRRPAAGAPSRLALLRFAAQSLRGLAGTAPITDRDYLKLFELAEGVADEAVPAEEMWSLSVALLASLDLAAARERRATNYRLLASELGRLGPQIRLVLGSELPAGSSPLVLPVRIAEQHRDALRAELAARGVFCPVHWPLPAEVDPAAYPDAARLAGEMLGLPIDQRYGDDDMAYVAEAVEHAWAALC